jgi:hypothetical protein
VAGLSGQQCYRKVYRKVSHVVLWQDCLVNSVTERCMGRYHMWCCGRTVSTTRLQKGIPEGITCSVVAGLSGQQGYRKVYGEGITCCVVAGLSGQQGYRKVYGEVSHVVLWQDCLVNKVIESYDKHC